MERAVGKNEKLESPKLESLAEVGKNRAKLERTERSWKVSLKLESFAAVGTFWLMLESCDLSWKVYHKFQMRVRELKNWGKGNL